MGAVYSAPLELPQTRCVPLLKAQAVRLPQLRPFQEIRGGIWKIQAWAFLIPGERGAMGAKYFHAHAARMDSSGKLYVE